MSLPDPTGAAPGKAVNALEANFYRLGVRISQARIGYSHLERRSSDQVLGAISRAELQRLLERIAYAAGEIAQQFSAQSDAYREVERLAKEGAIVSEATLVDAAIEHRLNRMHEISVVCANRHDGDATYLNWYLLGHCIAEHTASKERRHESLIGILAENSTIVEMLQSTNANIAELVPELDTKLNNWKFIGTSGGVPTYVITDDPQFYGWLFIEVGLVRLRSNASDYPRRPRAELYSTESCTYLRVDRDFYPLNEAEAVVLGELIKAQGDFIAVSKLHERFQGFPEKGERVVDRINLKLQKQLGKPLIDTKKSAGCRICREFL